MMFTAPQLFDAKTELIHFTLSGSMLIVVAILTGRLSELRTNFKAQNIALVQALAHIQALATRDDLTSLPNRRYMTDLLDQEERRRAHDGLAACLAILDIDWFKKVNDTFGHAAGDEVLRRFSETCLRNLRGKDVLARWGGEEFLLYLPDTRLDAAVATVDRLMQQVRALRFQFDGKQVDVSFSAGLIEQEPGETIAHGIKRADALLYQAKAAGRNRVLTEASANPDSDASPLTPFSPHPQVLPPQPRP
jgi:diguanylate cyclase (GGDEF)-like protein